MGLAGCLVCVSGDELGRTLRVDRAVVIGRRGDLALASTDVSRRHARVIVTDHGHMLEDLGSANGTYLDGVRVVGPTPLRFGAHIQVGRTIVLFSRYDDEIDEHVVRSERLDGIAHDFANALAVIVSNLEPRASPSPGTVSSRRCVPPPARQPISSAVFSGFEPGTTA